MSGLDLTTGRILCVMERLTDEQVAAIARGHVYPQKNYIALAAEAQQARARRCVNCDHWSDAPAEVLRRMAHAPRRVGESGALGRMRH